MKTTNIIPLKHKNESRVIVKHLNHYFSGLAKLNPEDNWSEYTGCRYAEMRAIIKALKYEYKEKKKRYEACEKFVKNLFTSKKFDKDSDTAKVIFKQLNGKKKELNNFAKMIEDLENRLKNNIEAQDKFKKDIAKIKKDKNNKTS